MSERDDASRGADRALLALLGYLKGADYAFVTPTPATHQIVLGRPDQRRAKTLRDIFGWSLPFDRDAARPELLAIMAQAGVLQEEGGYFRSRVRASSLGGELFLHSAFPPSARDAVFFGPDTYRFADFLRRALDGASPIDTLVDVGTGSGAGAIVARRSVSARRTILTDINPEALRVAAVNAEAACLTVETRKISGLDGLVSADVIVANPPFIADSGGRTYRNGGDMHGTQIALDWALAGARILTPGGQLLMYTGSPVLEGRHPLLTAVQGGLDQAGFQVKCVELDPDIFGEELQREVYRDVERIAAIGLTIAKAA